MGLLVLCCFSVDTNLLKFTSVFVLMKFDIWGCNAITNNATMRPMAIKMWYWKWDDDIRTANLHSKHDATNERVIILHNWWKYQYQIYWLLRFLEALNSTSINITFSSKIYTCSLDAGRQWFKFFSLHLSLHFPWMSEHNDLTFEYWTNPM